jgi:formylglycine-generating enzyme required for sulfatase activity
MRYILVAAAFTAAVAAVANAQQRALPNVGWVRVPAGSFDMGCVPADMRCDADESPRHRVTITRAFDMMATEVTKAMYNAVMPEEEQPAWSASPQHPIAIVDWEEASKFCQAVGGRLPTEAEWEYAARGGRAATIYAWGDNDPSDTPGARNGATFETDSPAPVRSFGANGFGLYDMSGNVWEWVNDRYGAYPEAPATDPQGPVAPVQAAPQPQQGGRGQVAAAQFGVVRGGAYGDDPRNLRLSNRTPNRRNAVNQNVGFRCARSMS